MEFTVNGFPKHLKNENGFNDVIYTPVDIEFFPSAYENTEVKFYNRKNSKLILMLTTDDIKTLYAAIHLKEKEEIELESIKKRK
jgi:hypothetical protein